MVRVVLGSRQDLLKEVISKGLTSRGQIVVLQHQEDLRTARDRRVQTAVVSVLENVKINKDRVSADTYDFTF